MPLKFIHIHNDVKFIDETVIFENPSFINEVIIIGEKGKYKGKYEETATYVESSRSDINWLINHCNDADMVVLYNLCLIKSFVANRLTGQVKIAWRFFGHELYRYNIAEQQSEVTKEVLNPDSRCLRRLKNIKLVRLRNLIKFRVTYNLEFTKAMNRVDLFLWHYREEYEYLKESWPDLPQFVNLPTFNLPSLNNHHGHSNEFIKHDNIILGNNKNPLNNHLDILNLLFSIKNFNKYNIIIPFSYGEETNYSVKLREKIKSHKNIKLIENFLLLDEYAAIFKKASALVINTYRQKALGNILLALKNGLKIYLNNKNIIYSILASQGFLVYSTTQLGNDLKNNNIRLTTEDAEHNLNLSRKFRESNSVALFQQRIQDVLVLN